MAFEDSLTRSRKGDPSAQEELFARWRPLLRLQARRLLGAELESRLDPSDVVQESLLQASQDLEKFRGNSQGEWVAWLQRIVAGQSAKARRFHHAGRRSLNREEPAQKTDVSARQADAIAQAIDTEEAARLAVALEALPEPMRELLVRRLVDREPAASLAKAMGLTVPAIRSLLTRALRRIRQIMESESQSL